MKRPRVDVPTLEKSMQGLNINQGKPSIGGKKRTYKQLVRCDDRRRQLNVTEQMMYKASDCVELVSRSNQLNSDVTNNFVTNTVELSGGALQKIDPNFQQDSNNESMVLRFVKPSTEFYSNAISVFNQLNSKNQLAEMDEQEYRTMLIEQMGERWKESFNNPSTELFKTAKNEFMFMMNNTNMD